MALGLVPAYRWLCQHHKLETKAGSTWFEVNSTQFVFVALILAFTGYLVQQLVKLVFG